MNLRLLGNRILVRPDRPADRTVAGVRLYQPNHPPCTGVVIGVGTSKLAQDSGLTPGDRVAFRPFAGYDLSWQDIKHRMLTPEELLGALPSLPPAQPSAQTIDISPHGT